MRSNPPGSWASHSSSGSTDEAWFSQLSLYVPRPGRRDSSPPGLKLPSLELSGRPPLRYEPQRRDTQRAICNVRRTTCAVQHAAYNAQRAICNVRRAACDVQRAACNAQRALCNVRRAACNVQRAACNAPRAICNVRRAAYDVHISQRGIQTIPWRLCYLFILYNSYR